MSEREVLELDVLFVGAGPASLAGAIHLQKLPYWNSYRIMNHRIFHLNLK